MKNDTENPTAPNATGLDLADTPTRKTGDRVPLGNFAKPADGDEEYTAIGETIHAQMGLYRHKDPAIRSAWAIQGKYGHGGDLLILDPERTTGHGDAFAVSYHYGWDEYTVTFAKRGGDLTEIIEEVDHIHADQLCELFSNMTGIQIPVVTFG